MGIKICVLIANYQWVKESNWVNWEVILDCHSNSNSFRWTSFLRFSISIPTDSNLNFPVSALRRANFAAWYLFQQIHFVFFFCCMSADFGDLKILLTSERLPVYVDEASKMSCESVSRNAFERLFFCCAELRSRIGNIHAIERSTVVSDNRKYKIINL